MSRSSKYTSTSQKTGRSAATGRFMGRAKDGTVIAKPDFKPRNFSIDKLRRVIRDIQREEANVKAG